MKGKLIMIPNLLCDGIVSDVIPDGVLEAVKKIRHFIVEDVRTARRYLKKIDKSVDIDSLTFYLLNKHTEKTEIRSYLKPAIEGHDVGVISEAGVPGVADPGAEIVAIGHELDIKVVPLTGPSSIIMALMASGLNGQNFLFHGYLPFKSNDRAQDVRKLEEQSRRQKQTQVFIENPFRNEQMLKDILRTCNPTVRLCIACNITAENEFIKTKTIAQWQKNIPDIQKKPAVFLLLA
ncbi:MAG: SAM-dependent methyltransferase [Bacteroidota bacterium]